MDDIIEEMKDISQTGNDIDTIANAMILDQITYDEATNALMGVSCLHKLRTSKLMDSLNQILHLEDDEDFPNDDQETSEK
jgi:hypothetical protein